MSSDPQGVPKRSFRQKTLPALTKLLHGSAPFISTFLLIHLTAPTLANLGGSSLASSVLVATHLTLQTIFLTMSSSSWVVNTTRPNLERNTSYSDPLPSILCRASPNAYYHQQKTPPRPWTSLLSLTGYANIIFFLPHFMAHRVHPQTPTAPIYAVGPSELDFEFVKYGLANWPWQSWLLYGGLVASVVLHVVDGERLLFNTYFGETMGRIKAAARKRLLAIGLGLVAVPVLAGTYVMTKEPLMILASTAERFHASFTKSPFYRL